MGIFDLKTTVIIALAITIYLQIENPEKVSGFLPKFFVGFLSGFTVFSEIIVWLNSVV